MVKMHMGSTDPRHHRKSELLLQGCEQFYSWLDLDLWIQLPRCYDWTAEDVKFCKAKLFGDETQCCTSSIKM